MYKINSQIFKAIELDNTPQEERYFVIDDTILAKLGKKIENVSYIYDHNIGRSVLGFCVVILGLFTAHGFYPLDFAYCFGQKRNKKSPEENIGDPRTSSGRRSFEAKHYAKLELALMMIKSAVNCGIVPGYVLCLLLGIAFSKLNETVQGMRIKHDYAEPIWTFGFM